MLTLVKWISNPDLNSKNRIITRTLGKIGLMPSKVLFQGGDLPRPDEFWYSEIVCETKPGNQGVFVLRPIKRIEDIPHHRGRRPNFEYLVPSKFSIVRKRNAVLLYPERKGPHWICAKSLRKFLLGMHRQDKDYPVNSVIVVFDNAEDWETHGLEDGHNRPARKPAKRKKSLGVVRPIPGMWTAGAAGG